MEGKLGEQLLEQQSPLFWGKEIREGEKPRRRRSATPNHGLRDRAQRGGCRHQLAVSPHDGRTKLHRLYPFNSKID